MPAEGPGGPTSLEPTRFQAVPPDKGPPAPITHPRRRRTRRPAGITILCFLLTVGITVMVVRAALGLLGAGGADPASVGLLVPATLNAGLVYGLATRRRWAWWITVITQALAGGLALAGVLVAAETAQRQVFGLITVLEWGIVLYLLLVRRWYWDRLPAPPHPADQ